MKCIRNNELTLVLRLDKADAMTALNSTTCAVSRHTFPIDESCWLWHLISLQRLLVAP